SPVAARLGRWPAAVGRQRGGHLLDRQHQPGAHRHPARQLPGPGGLRQLCLWPRRPGRDPSADLRRVRLRRRARGTWRLGPGGGVPHPALGGHLPRRGAGRGGGQAGRPVAAAPAAAPLHHARRDRARGRRRLGVRRPGERRVRVQRAVHHGGLSLPNLVETEVLRGLLTPLGHGLWTAILGGVLFRTAAEGGRLRLSGALVGWYLLVAGLHALWDAARPIAVWLTLVLTATQVQWQLIRMGRVPQPTQAQVHTFTTLNMAVLLLDALLGVAIL